MGKQGTCFSLFTLYCNILLPMYSHPSITFWKSSCIRSLKCHISSDMGFLFPHLIFKQLQIQSNLSWRGVAKLVWTGVIIKCFSALAQANVSAFAQTNLVLTSFWWLLRWPLIQRVSWTYYKDSALMHAHKELWHTQLLSLSTLLMPYFCIEMSSLAILLVISFLLFEYKLPKSTDYVCCVCCYDPDATCQ
jgi:hypothetical protein